jgi:Family of unknown function (DUF6338)
MADALTAEEVGRILTFVAPGFFAWAAFRAVFPQRDRGQLEMLVIAVATSLPLVAVANFIADECDIERTDPTKLGYVALLIGVSLLAGYAFAIFRGWGWIREKLSWVGLRYQPESSIYAQTLLRLAPDARATVTFKDGRELTGVPRIGPGRSDTGVRELYLTYPQWYDHRRAEWVDGAAGVIANLDEVHHITLEDDPT